MPKAGKKNHIFGDFFSEATKKNAKTGKEFGIEGKKGDIIILRGKRYMSLLENRSCDIFA